jgi:hypothetical protein
MVMLRQRFSYRRRFANGVVGQLLEVAGEVLLNLGSFSDDLDGGVAGAGGKS